MVCQCAVREVLNDRLSLNVNYARSSPYSGKNSVESKNFKTVVDQKCDARV